VSGPYPKRVSFRSRATSLGLTTTRQGNDSEALPYLAVGAPSTPTLYVPLEVEAAQKMRDWLSDWLAAHARS